ncbi:MAG TPA: hypothetical protein DDW17_02060 [Deltaproteobacteria bacterium]|nr:hypothetical protein [Deltaproteobacteria bacterium]
MIKKMSMTYEGTILEDFAKKESALALIAREYDRAAETNGTFHSAHEGYAVILEELDELKAEVWRKASKRDTEKMKKEAVQVGAMALRFIVDVI